jgi:diaminopimelate decarboxylase
VDQLHDRWNRLNVGSLKQKTPFYVYDLEGITKRAAEYQAAFAWPDVKAHIHYALKANANREVLSAIRSQGCGADVVSGGEYKRAIECGFRPQDIVFSGVGKTRDEIEMVLQRDLRTLNVESVPELKRVIEIARSQRRNDVPVLLRVNPNVDAKTHPNITTGLRENKFGLDMADVPEALELLSQTSAHVQLKGFAMHIGSQLLDLSAIVEGVRRVLDLFSNLRDRFPGLSILDAGGGLGIAYREESAPTLSEYAQSLYRLVQNKNVELFIEPGRSMVGAFGLLITEVQYVKKTPHKTFVIVDTGMHHFMRPALYQGYHGVVNLTRKGGGRLVADVVGPICESTDVLARDREISEVQEGDRLALCDVGAYGFVLANSYNLHAQVEELVL